MTRYRCGDRSSSFAAREETAQRSVENELACGNILRQDVYVAEELSHGALQLASNVHRCTVRGWNLHDERGTPSRRAALLEHARKVCEWRLASDVRLVCVQGMQRWNRDEVLQVSTCSA